MDENNLKKDSLVSLTLQAAPNEREEERLFQVLKEKIKRYGKVRVLLVLENYPAADSAESLYEDMRFLKLHAEDIERLAVVGERAWQETWVALFGLFGGMETAYFDRSEKKEAAAWISEEGASTD